MLDILLQQLSDPFRIGLLAALVVTTMQTSAHTGRVVPLLVGAMFVAVLIPTTMGSDAGNRMVAIGIGLLANAVILAAILGLVGLWRRVMGGQQTPKR